MPKDKAAPEEPVPNDPQPHEGDQAKEMIEEGRPSEPEALAPEAEVPEVDEMTGNWLFSRTCSGCRPTL
jgi:hypothetical protein